MLDHCSRSGCPQIRVIRTVNTYGYTERRWFCSQQCADAGKPVHWVPPGWLSSACGTMSPIPSLKHRFTEDPTLVGCGNCKRADIYKKALAAAA